MRRKKLQGFAKRSLACLLGAALAAGCMAPAGPAVSKAAEKKELDRPDNSIVYFVDCGDYVTNTVCKGDQLGTRNSVTDQVYGEDPATGYKWGISDKVSDPLKNGTHSCGGVFTDSTWPYESNAAGKDAASKTASNRYTKNQYENGVEIRKIDYKFDLPAGKYEVETYCTNPWSCSNSPSLLLNSTNPDKDYKAGKGIKVAVDNVVKKTVTMEKDGTLTVSFRADTDDNKAINVCYIQIVDTSKKPEIDENEERAAFEADVNAVQFRTAQVDDNLVLPTEGANGSSISWSSSNPNVIAADGTVKRPKAGEADAKVTLEATIEMNDLKTKKKFDFTVLAENNIKDIKEFALDEVEIEDSYYLAAQNSDIRFLEAFDNDRLLSRFRETAGLDTKGKEPYGGWENSYIGGHSVGHYLSACAQAVRATGNTKLKSKLETLITGLKECQDKLGTGFIFGAQIEDKKNVEKQFNIVEGKDEGSTWVPWYTMHKILTGLLDVYKYTDNEQALKVAGKLGDWIYNRVDNWDPATNNKVLWTEYGGMNDCLYELYSFTGSAKHKEAAHKFDDPNLYKTITSGKKNTLKGKHANTTIPKFIGAIKRYEVLTEKGEAAAEDKEYLTNTEKFWQLVVDKHSYITGGVSDMEHFRGDNLLDETRTQCNCESCCAYNLLKMSKELYKVTGEKKYADYYENTLRNAIMGAVNTENGTTTYFTPMATGYYKVFCEKNPADNMFWCCTGSGMENFTKLGDSIYFKAPGALFVNQYVASSVKWQEGNMKISQDSDVTKSDTAKFTIHMLNDAAEQNAAIYLRIPDWIAGEPTVTVNGETVEGIVSGGYFAVSRSWKENDELSIRYPMEVTACGLPDNSSVYAFKYGPTVLAAKLGTEKMDKTVWAGANLTAPGYKVVGSESAYLQVTYNATARQILGTETLLIDGDTSVDGYMKNINRYLVRDSAADGLVFHLKGTDAEQTFGGNLTFVPYNTLNNERYGIYWYFDSKQQTSNEDRILADKEEGRFGKSILDSIQPGYGQYEKDNLHQMEQLNSEEGTIEDGGSTRFAKSGGYFQYNLVVDKDKKNSVLCQFAKEDNGKSLKISVGDTVIATESKLNYTGDDTFYKVYYAIPADVLAKNAKTISVKDDSGETKTYTVVTVKFESASATENSARLVGGVYMTTAYSDQAKLTSLTSEEGKVSETADGYEVVLPDNVKSTKLKFNIADQYGLLYINDVLVNDAKAQSFTLKENEKTMTLNVKVYAEDHKTVKEYKVLIKSASAEDPKPSADPSKPSNPDNGKGDTGKKKTTKKSIKISGKKKVKKGKSIVLKAKLTGVSGKVKWSVNRKKLAKITPKGKKGLKAKLKGLKRGKVKVTAKVGKVKKTIKITIK